MGDRLLIGSCSGVFLALDRRTGEELWRYDTRADGDPAEFHGDPIVVAERVVTGCDRTTLAHTYAFSLATGQVLWKQPGAAFASDILHIEGLVIGRRWNGDLMALSVRDGQPCWTVPPHDYTYRFRPDASPVACEGVVYFGGVDGAVYAVAGTSGEVLWRQDLGAAITTSVVADGQDLYVGVASDRLYHLATRDGTLLAELLLPGRPFGRPVLAPEAVLALVAEADLIACGRDLAEIRWSRRADSTWSSNQPLLWRGTVVAGTPQGEVCGIQLADGQDVFAFNVGGMVRGLGADEEILYVGTLGGTLYACRPGFRK